VKKSKPSLKLLGLMQLAGALDIDGGTMSHWADEKGFPFHVKDGRRKFVLEEAQAWIRKNKKRKRKQKIVEIPEKEGGSPSVSGTSPAPELTETQKVLTCGTASALDISRAVVQLVAARVAKDEFSPNDVDALKKSLGELRQAEADYLELAEKQGQLIDRDIVRGLVGACCTRLVQCLGNLENAIGSEFAVWLADPAIHLMPAQDRTRKVREFVAKTCYEVRRQEAESVDKLIEQARKDAEE
jgi:hypothetical protein